MPGVQRDSATPPGFQRLLELVYHDLTHRISKGFATSPTAKAAFLELKRVDQAVFGGDE